tara:strand:- start:10147 stop:11571 length:1425 start_codon:yes stop_codon:yes gene_type:complete
LASRKEGKVRSLVAFIAFASLVFSGFSAQTPFEYSATFIPALSTNLDDLPFGADSDWIYVMQYGSESGAKYFRAPRKADATSPGILEQTSIQAVRDEAWSGLGVISHVSVDTDRQIAVISAKPYPGAGDFDLFISSLTKKGYSRPYPLYSLNTSGDEVYPQFTSSGLYYSSSNDIYFASRKHQWQKSELLPSPINTPFDEISIAILNDHEMYVSSNRKGEGFDVYLLSYSTGENLATGYYIELVSDGNPLVGVEIKWVEIETNNPVFEGTTNGLGTFSLDGLPSSRTLSLSIGSVEKPAAPGSLVKIINSDGVVVRTYSVGISGFLSADFLPLDKIEHLSLLDTSDSSLLPDRSPAMISLHFDLDSTSPNSTSLHDLESWWDVNGLRLLSTEDALVIEGHADITGGVGANDILSEKRAVWFKEWLKENGVIDSKLSTRGMGARFPLELCLTRIVDCPPEIHAANRRVELRWKVD